MSDVVVLVVDDDERNRKLVCDVLAAAGMRTLVARTGREAIDVATADRPSVVLLDLRLPDMDGSIVARALRSSAATSAIPVVALTSLPIDDAEWLVAGGFDGYVGKPIDIRQFPDVVRRYVVRDPVPPEDARLPR